MSKEGFKFLASFNEHTAQQFDQKGQHRLAQRFRENAARYRSEAEEKEEPVEKAKSAGSQ